MLLETEGQESKAEGTEVAEQEKETGQTTEGPVPQVDMADESNIKSDMDDAEEGSAAEE